MGGNKIHQEYVNRKVCTLVSSVQFDSIPQSCLTLCNPMDCSTHQASLFITNCRSLPKLMSNKLMMPSNHLILCCPFLLLLSVFPSIRVFSNKSILSHQVAKVLEFQLQLNIEWIFRTDFLYNWLVGSPCSPRDSLRVFSNTTVQKHQFFGAQLSSQSNSHSHTWPLEKP